MRETAERESDCTLNAHHVNEEKLHSEKLEEGEWREQKCRNSRAMKQHDTWYWEREREVTLWKGSQYLEEIHLRKSTFSQRSWEKRISEIFLKREGNRSREPASCSAEEKLKANDLQCEKLITLMKRERKHPIEAYLLYETVKWRKLFLWNTARSIQREKCSRRPTYQSQAREREKYRATINEAEKNEEAETVLHLTILYWLRNENVENAVRNLWCSIFLPDSTSCRNVWPSVLCSSISHWNGKWLYHGLVSSFSI